ncbi:MAG: hypothetical protein IT161_17655 [Bryobacterales bacterium]|nr:hypothetical protein [Bryobacterales bacterium]
MTLGRIRLVTLASLSLAIQAQPSLSGHTTLRNVDWANFTYPFLSHASLPRELHWHKITSDGSAVTLARGIHRFEIPGCQDSGLCPLVTYEFTEYGKVSGLRGELAAVVLTFSPNPKLGWQIVYLYSTDNDKPKLLAWFEAGHRFSQGLKGLAIDGGSLVLDLYDPERRLGESCSLGFKRIRYRWKKETFEQYGDPVPGYVPFENCRSAVNPVLKRRQP